MMAFSAFRGKEFLTSELYGFEQYDPSKKGASLSIFKRPSSGVSGLHNNNYED